MPTIEISPQSLLNALQQMRPEEFDALIERALSLRAQRKTTALSPTETKLLVRINRGLPLDLAKRAGQLRRKRKSRTLTEAERQELIELTHAAECRDADRAAALLELARLRNMPLRVLMKEMGIKPLRPRGM